LQRLTPALCRPNTLPGQGAQGTSGRGKVVATALPPVILLPMICTGLLPEPRDQLTATTRCGDELAPFVAIAHPVRKLIALILCQLPLRILCRKPTESGAAFSTQDCAGVSNFCQPQPDFAVHDTAPALRLDVVLEHLARRTGEHGLFQFPQHHRIEARR